MLAFALTSVWEMVSRQVLVLASRAQEQDRLTSHPTTSVQLRHPERHPSQLLSLQEEAQLEDEAVDEPAPDVETRSDVGIVDREPHTAEERLKFRLMDNSLTRASPLGATTSINAPSRTQPTLNLLLDSLQVDLVHGRFRRDL